jgi:putative membrane protein
MRHLCLGLGVLLLAVVWLGPLPALATTSFTAHMLIHLAVVAVASPLIAIGLAALWPSPHRLPAALPLLASLLELVVVWAWHAPALHRAARSGGGPAMMVEQGSFLVVGLALWLTVLLRPAGGRDAGAIAGAAALFFTSMHMTLLGVLIALAPGPLFHTGHAGPTAFGLAAAADRQLGGILMLAVGGTGYLVGGLALVGTVLRTPAAHRNDGR